MRSAARRVSMRKRARLVTEGALLTRLNAKEGVVQ